jgi:hypothetical protein
MKRFIDTIPEYPFQAPSGINPASINYQLLTSTEALGATEEARDKPSLKLTAQKMPGATEAKRPASLLIE